VILFQTLADYVVPIEPARHIVVTLSEAECNDLRSIGRARHFAKSPTCADAVRVHDVVTLEDEIGILGEGAFEKLTGLPMNREIRRGGDGGRDFSFPYNGRTISIAISVARIPVYLFMHAEHRAGTPRADIWVLGTLAKDMQSVAFLGYQTKSYMLALPPVPCRHPILAAQGRKNHECPRGALKPMQRLIGIITAVAA